MTRRERLDALVVEIEPVGSQQDLGLADLLGLDGSQGVARYVFVQANHGAAKDSQSHWFSAGDDMEALGRDWLGDEYREDWEPVVILDLDTGRKFLPVLDLRFEPQQ